MRDQITDEKLNDVTGGAIDYHWDPNTQSGSVSSNITGQSFTFGADKAMEIYQYVMMHQMFSDDSQMNDIWNIINS